MGTTKMQFVVAIFVFCLNIKFSVATFLLSFLHVLDNQGNNDAKNHHCSTCSSNLTIWKKFLFSSSFKVVLNIEASAIAFGIFKFTNHNKSVRLWTLWNFTSTNLKIECFSDSNVFNNHVFGCVSIVTKSFKVAGDFARVVVASNQVKIVDSRQFSAFGARIIPM